MSSALEMATDLLSKIGKPAYVEFRQGFKTIKGKDGYPIDINIDLVTVRQIGSPDSSIFEVENWLKQQAIEVQSQRLPREHFDYYKRAYAAWKEGRAIPVEGTPILGWAMLSAAQQETVLRVGVRTVEDLSTMNAEACTRIGMGAIRMKQAAAAWLAQAQEKGPLTAQMVAVQQENELLKAQLEKLTAIVEDLRQTKPKTKVAEEVLHEEDLLDAIEPERKRPGRRKEA